MVSAREPTNILTSRRLAITPSRTLFFLPVLVVVLFYAGVLFLTVLNYPPVRFFSILASPEVREAIVLSLVTATGAGIVAMVLGVPMAYFLARRDFAGKIVVDALLDVPVFISPIAIGALLLVAFSTAQGRWLQEHVGEIVFEVPGIIIAQATIVTALAVRLMKATFEAVPLRYEKVARSLGCTEWNAFWKVVLPLSKSGLMASAILVWARALGEFGATVTLAGATERKTATIPTSIYLSFASADVDRALTLVLILLLVATASLIGLRRVAGKTLEI
ncbi:MAG: ABC transporter permease subunit [Candidatus Abyssobacteria bacterium SURF_17]|jgi:molybdate transport system permease protein|uniref:ABC transporter permease subunit n=1 Tax=Candidatus Abyssobacteria bacterium SURF_17 TaxID=2093361 RepID=A0A419ENT7_9BACT|nr:MAG: ABC transporter permease subunit [Candidatus Abyssubacteria bacterium SURF_17]